MKNINKFFIFIKNIPFFHFFSYASSINKLVIFWTLYSLFYLINYCIFDSYELFSKRSRQKGKILLNSPLTVYRQNSKMIKILYIKESKMTDRMNGIQNDIMDRGNKRHGNRGTDGGEQRCNDKQWNYLFLYLLFGVILKSLVN